MPKETMYGSIHTHFESQFDTANKDFQTMLRSFQALGAKKVAVTDHGVFSAYEDVLDAVNKMKKNGEGIDLDLIPGSEVYFAMDETSPDSHMLLFAKDYEGYQSLCRIITQSNHDFRKNKVSGGKPIVTLQNLRKNVKKGHLYCTSACIAGIFGSRFGLNRMKQEEKIAEQLQKVKTQPLDEALLFTKEQFKQEKAFAPLLAINYGDSKKDEVYLVRDLLKQKPKTEAEQLLYRFHVTKANWAIAEYLRKEKAPKGSKTHPPNPLACMYFEIRKDAYEHIRGYTQKKPQKVLFTTLQGYVDALRQMPSEEQSLAQCKSLYNKLVQIFGREYFYFELQYHGLEAEALLYPKVIEFAETVKNTNHFIASNDIHIGISRAYVCKDMSKTEAENRWEQTIRDEVIKRDVIQFTRFNKFFGDNDTIPADSGEYIIKSDEELRMRLREIIPDEEILDNAFANIKNTLCACHVEFPKGQNHYPQFCEHAEEEFDRQLAKGITKKFPNGFPSEKYQKTLEYESHIIKEMGYASYHLIVADYLAYGRKLSYLPDDVIASDACPMTMQDLDAYIKAHHITPNAYGIGPGRGSAAGSLSCYILDISDVDPIPLGLYFERYLNPERVSMPDIDSDFSPTVRGRCVEYVKIKYGYDAVCSISTKTYAATKGAIRIAGRYLGTKQWLHSEEKKEADEKLTGKEISKKAYNETFHTYMKRFYSLCDGLCKAYDEYEKKKEEKKEKGSFTESYQGTTDEQKLLKLVPLIEGCFTGYGQHAAGTIISKDMITDSIPLMFAEGKENMETQCNMAQAEAKGFLKMDFLGLKNLSIITNIMRKTKDYKLLDYTFRDTLLNDKRIYKEIYSTGLTQGVFQFESPGMKTFLQRLQPDCFEDIILMNAAYRPGPMQFLDEVVAEKQYRRAKAAADSQIMENGSVLCADGTIVDVPVHSLQIDSPVLREILAPTYGCIIYQEQIMQICQRLAGFSMGRADIVRKYMSKKKEEELAHERPDFVQGCVACGDISEGDASLLFDCMIDFAKYAFNKSHAAVYALISLQTAYLKLYHPAVFFAESLNAVENLDEILDFTIEMPIFGITLHAPDIIHCADNFLALNEDVYYGLGFIKGLSGVDYKRANTYLDFIIENRETITEKTMEKLIKCGLFDSMEPAITRLDLCEETKHIYKALTTLDKARTQQQTMREQMQWLKQFQKPRLSLQEKTKIRDYLKLRKTAEKITPKDIDKKLQDMQAKVNAANYQLLAMEENLESGLAMLRLTSRHTPESIIWNRKNELELLGYVFDIRHSQTVIDACNAFPKQLVDKRSRVEMDIPNLGLIVLNPKVKVTPGGWTKILCCDKNRTYKHIYFNGPFPEDITEFAFTFQAEKLQEKRSSEDGKLNSNNMYVAPHAYELCDIGFRPTKHFYVEHKEEFLRITPHILCGQAFHPTAYLHCEEYGNLHLPCKAETVEAVLKQQDIFYVMYD